MRGTRRVSQRAQRRSLCLHTGRGSAPSHTWRRHLLHRPCTAGLETRAASHAAGRTRVLESTHERSGSESTHAATSPSARAPAELGAAAGAAPIPSCAMSALSRLPAAGDANAPASPSMLTSPSELRSSIDPAADAGPLGGAKAAGVALKSPNPASGGGDGLEAGAALGAATGADPSKVLKSPKSPAPDAAAGCAGSGEPKVPNSPKSSSGEEDEGAGASEEEAPPEGAGGAAGSGEAKGGGEPNGVAPFSPSPGGVPAAAAPGGVMPEGGMTAPGGGVGAKPPGPGLCASTSDTARPSASMKRCWRREPAHAPASLGSGCQSDVLHANPLPFSLSASAEASASSSLTPATEEEAEAEAAGKTPASTSLATRRSSAPSPSKADALTRPTAGAAGGAAADGAAGAATG
mmetsp:Transcript_37944/g.123386  ORF Transcript_37944/g.123386 Transcript_37944/m.123386 type:complete len:407 (-) Transcript_37944:181-1401(-)